MLLGISLDEAIELPALPRTKNGEPRKTYTHQLLAALRQGNMKCGSKLAWHGDLPEHCIIKANWARHGWHWMIRRGDVLYDPWLTGPVAFESGMDWTSYISIE